MNKILLFLIFIGIVACNPTVEKERKKEIFFSKQETQSDLYDLLQNKRYITLETTDESLFSDITQFLCSSKELFIFDIQTQSIYVFDYDGKFLRKLNKKGQGPGEYALITAFTLNENTNRLSVVSIGNSVLSYDINSFEFIEEQKIKSVAVEIDDELNYYAYNSLPTTKSDTDFQYHIIKYNKEGEIEKTFLPIAFASGYVMRPVHRFYRNENRLYTYLPYSSKIYQINPDTCILYCDTKYENLSYPSLDYLNSTQKANNNYIKELSEEDYIYNVQLFENKEFIVSLFDVGKNHYIGLYNKNKKKGVYYLRGEQRELLEKTDCLQIIGSYKHEFISVIRETNVDKEENPKLLFFQLKENVSK